MPFDVAAIQQTLKAEGLDGWLLYDFHGSNPIAARLVGTANGSKMTTRRWFYLVPASGEPRGLVHAIERRTLDALPGEKVVYAGRQQLDAGLTTLLSGLKRVAMEYSRNCAIPYISRVDGGSGSKPYGTRTRSKRTATRRRHFIESRIAHSSRSRSGRATARR
jgi:Xaa-Pro dipeptidase